MKLKEHLRSIGVTLTVDAIARIHCYKTDTAFHNMYNRGDVEKLDAMALDAEERFASICYKRI